jgi:hypothetical protein
MGGIRRRLPGAAMQRSEPDQGYSKIRKIGSGIFLI